MNQMTEPTRKGFFAKLFDIEKDEEDKMDIEEPRTILPYLILIFSSDGSTK